MTQFFFIDNLHQHNLLEVINNISSRHGIDKHHQNITDACLTTTVWHIWGERCNRVFNKPELPYQIKFELIKQDVNILMTKQHMKSNLPEFSGS